jgi:hypothetical protein
MSIEINPEYSIYIDVDQDLSWEYIVDYTCGIMGEKFICKYFSEPVTQFRITFLSDKGGRTTITVEMIGYDEQHQLKLQVVECSLNIEFPPILVTFCKTILHVMKQDGYKFTNYKMVYPFDYWIRNRKSNSFFCERD